MQTDTESMIACPGCGKNTAAGKSTCDHCRLPLPNANQASSVRRQLRQMADTRWAVLALLFFVTAGFGLPVLWISRGFSPLAKVALTIIVVAYTALILWLIWLNLLWIGRSFSETWATFS